MAAEEERVKRPPNAWILFRTYYGGTQPVYPDGTRIPQNQISTVASKIWNKFSEPQRRPWEEQADQAKVAHMAAHPNWRYRPRSKALKEQQKLEERLAKAAAREEAKRAKQAAKRSASGAATNAGGVKRSPSRRLSPATMAASPYPCVSPLPGISLANFGPSPPVSAASSPMVGPLSLPPVAEQSPAATLVGTPDQPKYPVLMLDSHITHTNTHANPTPIPILTLNDTNDDHASNNAPAAIDNKDTLELELDFFTNQFNADGGLLHGGLGMGGGMGLMGAMNGDVTHADWAGPNPINHLGLMENTNLSFPLDPEVFVDFAGWAHTQIAENDHSVGATPGADLSGNSSGGSNSSNSTPDTSFELPFIFNMDAGSGFGFNSGINNAGNGAHMAFDPNVDLHLNLNLLNVDFGAAVAQPGGANGNGNGYFQDAYAGVHNFGGFDFSALADVQGDGGGDGDAGWTNGMGLHVNFDAFADLGEAQVGAYPAQDPDPADGGEVKEEAGVENKEKPIATMITSTAPTPAAHTPAAAHASPDMYASPSSYALQPVENLTDSSAASSGASTPSAHGHAHGRGGYAPPKGAGNGNRRVAASFKVPPAIVRTASYGWVPGQGS